MVVDGYDELYQDVVLDHYKSPRNYQALQDADLNAEGFNPFCGDRVKFTARVNDSGEITEVGFTGGGCAISQASASMRGEQIKGLTLTGAERMVAQFKGMMQGKPVADYKEMGDLIALNGVRKFPVRIKCALLAWSALQDAIAEHRGRSRSSAR